MEAQLSDLETEVGGYRSSLERSTSQPLTANMAIKKISKSSKSKASAEPSKKRKREQPIDLELGDEDGKGED